MNDSLSPAAAVPPWAAFFTREQYAIFLALIADDLGSRPLAFTMSDGVVQASLDGGSTQQLGLQNLAQRCLRHDVPAWESLIHQHFSNVLVRESQPGEERPFEQLREHLKVRLYAEDFSHDVELVSTPVAPGLVAALTLDLPDAVVTVSPRQASGWGRPIEELMAQGLVNALDEPVERSTVEIAQGATLQVVEGESFFVTTRLLGLGDWLSSDLPHGALVSVPNRHLLLLHPIEDLRVVEVISTMLRCTQQGFRQGPGSLSRDLFWWHDGALSLLPSHEEQGHFTFSPPTDFLSCLERLAHPS